MSTPDDSRARRASGLSITPLTAIVAAFFLPTIRSCGVMRTPVTYIVEQPRSVPWLVSPYVAALVLALATSALFARNRTPSRTSYRFAWAAFGLTFLSTTMALMTWLSDDRVNIRIVAGVITMVCVGLVAVQRAIRFEGWSRWIRMLFAFAAMTAGNTVWVMVALAMGDGVWDAIGIGGHLFLWSVVAIALLAAYGVRPTKAVPTAS